MPRTVKTCLYRPSRHTCAGLQKSRAEAREIIREELHRLGYDGRVTWKGDSASASVGWGTVLNASGEGTDEAIVLEKCGGAIGGTVLGRCRELLERLFPGGAEA